MAADGGHASGNEIDHEVRGDAETPSATANCETGLDAPYTISIAAAVSNLDSTEQQ